MIINMTLYSKQAHAHIQCVLHFQFVTRYNLVGYYAVNPEVHEASMYVC